jgi:hypothetical protein
MSITSRQLGGYRARAAGGSLESLVIASQRDVRLVKIGNYAKRISGRAFGGCKLIEERSHFDFVGCYADGRFIAFDAKCAGPQLASLRVNAPSIVKPFQVEALQMFADAGGIAGILCECGRLRDVRWLPAGELRRAAPVRWDDAAWIVLGPSSQVIDFRRLRDVLDGRRAA